MPEFGIYTSFVQIASYMIAILDGGHGYSVTLTRYSALIPLTSSYFDKWFIFYLLSMKPMPKTYTVIRNTVKK